MSLDVAPTTAFAYDAAGDTLFVGAESVQAYPQASRLSGTVTAAQASPVELQLTGGTAQGIALDPGR